MNHSINAKESIVLLFLLVMSVNIQKMLPYLEKSAAEPIRYIGKE
jgi:hypothetical protein